MKRSYCVFVLSLCLTLVCSFATAQSDTLTILHFNATHSNLEPIGPRDSNLRGSMGGVARAATLIEMTKQEDPNAIVLHAGDTAEQSVQN